MADQTESHAEKGQREVTTRDKWKNKIDFAFSIAGGFVGLGNVWRFPYLCYKNGGGAFLIPYILFVAIGALPVFFLEVTLGQYTNSGSALAFRIVPLMKGLSITVNVINYHFNVYYAVILAWSLRYFFASMAKELPWSTCDNAWNTKKCFVYGKDLVNISLSEIPISNSTAVNGLAVNSTDKWSSVREFWELGVLRKSSGIDVIGDVQWELVLCLLMTWVILYFCVWRGIGWTSKVVYFTATFPLGMLFILLIRGLTLDGAVDGLVFYLKPDLNRLSDVQVWLDAATQVYFSYALCKGMLVTLGSYNSFHYNSYRDCIILSLLNSGVSFISGLAIFAVLGFMAKEQNIDISEVAESGPGLAFIAYPKALTLLPLPQLWGCLFFFMLFLLGLDSEFVALESMISTFVDLKPEWFKKPWRREMFLAFLCLTQFIVGLSMVTEGGVYVLNIFDNYAAAGWSLLFISFCQCAAVAWIFGINKYWRIVCDMIGFKPHLSWFKWCWFAVTPASSVVLIIVSIANYKSLTYNKTYTYPGWAIGVAWMLAMSSMIWIPIYAVYRLFLAEGSFKKKWKEVITSEYDDTNLLSKVKQQESDGNFAFETPQLQFEMAPLYEDTE